jgi:hypothetical protein
MEDSEPMTEPNRPFGSARALLGATLAATLFALPASAATLYTPPVNAQPGGSANVCVWMSGGNNEVAGVQMDLTWDPQCMLPASGGTRPKCRSNPDTGKTVQSALRGGSTLRAIMISFSDVEPIPDGELFCCEFRIVDNPKGSNCGLSFSNVIASTPRGERTDARVDSGRGGGIRIGGGAVTGGVVPSAPTGGGAVDSGTGSAPLADAGSADSGAPQQQEAAQPSGEPGSGRAAAEPDSGGTAGLPAGGAAAGAAGSAAGSQPGAADVPGSGEYAAGAGQAGTAGAAREGDAGFVSESGTDTGAADAAAADAADEDEAEGTETPEPATTPTPAATKNAAAAAAPTATKPAATPTPAQPTATPTVSAGFLGGCTLIVD